MSTSTHGGWVRRSYIETLIPYVVDSNRARVALYVMHSKRRAPDGGRTRHGWPGSMPGAAGPSGVPGQPAKPARRVAVARVLIRCPVSSELVSVGLEVADGPAFRKRVPRSGTLVGCVACGRRHEWWRAETYLEGRPPRRDRVGGDSNR